MATWKKLTLIVSVLAFSACAPAPVVESIVGSSGTSDTTDTTDTTAATTTVPATTPATTASSSTVETFTYGPVSLSPYNAVRNTGWSVVSPIVNGIDRPAGDVYVTGMEFHLVDAAGNRFDSMDVYLHHVWLENLSARDPFCGAQIFGGGTADGDAISLPSPYAYRVGAGDAWALDYHLMNMTSSAHDVYITYTLTYDTDASAHQEVTPYLLAAEGCGPHSKYTVPGTGGTGSIDEHAFAWTFPTGGTAVYANGHLHTGGYSITLQRADGEALCETEGRYMDDMLMSIATCTMNAPIAAGETITQLVDYRGDEARTDAMGHNILYMA